MTTPSTEGQQAKPKTRREVLHLGAGLMAMGALAACTPQTVQQARATTEAHATSIAKREIAAGEAKAAAEIQKLLQVNLTEITKARTAHQPAVAVYQGKVHVVYVGEGGEDLYTFTYDGANWFSQVKITDIILTQKSFVPHLK